MFSAAPALGYSNNNNTSPPYNECPAVGNDTNGCELLFVINPDGSVTVKPPSGKGPFDGADDTLIGVLNQSGQPTPSLTLSGTGTPAPFDFDGDGLCPFISCGYPDPTGYEGPDNTFTGISADIETGTVAFGGPVSPMDSRPTSRLRAT